MIKNKPFIKSLIDINQPMENDSCRYSTLSLLLKGARKLSGRDLKTGEYIGEKLSKQNIEDGTDRSFLFTGLMNYLIFLEQIGTIFNENPREKNNKIRVALKNFSSLTNKKINAVIALRNSFVHNYGLAAYDNNNSNRHLRHKFSLSIERNTDIVKLPIGNWGGDFSDKSDETLTEVYIIDLIDLIEGIYSQIREGVETDNLSSKLEEDEIKSRFTIIV